MAESELGEESTTKAPQSESALPHVLVLASEALFPHFFPESVISRLSESAEWSLHTGREDSSQLRTAIAQSDALITTWHSPFIRAEMLGDSPRVRLIAHCGGELKARMEECVFDRLTVTNAPGPMADGVAEMALAMVLMHVRRIPQYVEEMRAGLARTNSYASVGETLRGRKVGLVGFGRIGRAFARFIKPLGVELLVADPFCSAGAAAEYHARLAVLDELLSCCSVVVLAAALTPETCHLLDARRLSLLPSGAYLVNVARGGLIDLEALSRELRTGRIAAALDVTDPIEPLPEDHELRSMPNVYLTPHIAAGGVEVRAAMGAVAVADVARFFRGETPHNVVTREMLATMT